MDGVVASLLMPSIDGTLARIRNTYRLRELYTGNVGLTKVTINGS